MFAKKKVLSAKEINRHGLKDRREYRVNDTTGLENVGPVQAPQSSNFLANFRHDWKNLQNTKPQRTPTR